MSSVYIRRNDQLLLLYRTGGSIVNNLWIGSAGGHFEPAEIKDAKACVLRELFEELSLTESALRNLSLRYITLRYTDGEIRQNYYYFAELSDNDISISPSTEGLLQWFPISELNNLPMPITAKQILEHYTSTGQYNDNLYTGISRNENIDFIIL